MIGKTISHYKVLEKLGEGGMGEVFLAEDLELHSNDALQFLKINPGVDPLRDLPRFQQILGKYSEDK